MRQTAVTDLLTARTVRTQKPRKACECLGQLFGEMVLFWLAVYITQCSAAQGNCPESYVDCTDPPETASNTIL